MLRGTLGITVFMGSMWSLTMIPLTLSVLVFNTAPFWTNILGFCNKEQFSWVDFLVMAVCFLGVVGIAFSAPADQQLV